MEKLRVLPGLQFEESARSGLTGGEVLPPEISISGGRPYQNGYLLDGVSIGSRLDPTADTPSAHNEVPGHSQALTINPEVVSEVKLQRYNISPRYGRFTGGVMAAQTATPASVFQGDVFYRTTRDAWTRFHFADDSSKEAFAHSSNTSEQPRFRKHEYGLTNHIPIPGGPRLLLAWRRQQSRIPLSYFEGSKSQHRYLDQLFAKAFWRPTTADEISCYVQHNPYTGEYFLEDTLNSEYDLQGGGTQAGLRWDRQQKWGEVQLNLAWQKTESTRQAPNIFKQWAITPSCSWGNLAHSSHSQTGGYGDLEQRQQSWHMQLNIQGKRQQLGFLSHRLAGGMAYIHTQGDMDREGFTSYYDAVTEAPLHSCAFNDNACIPGEQYLNQRRLYGPGSAAVSSDQWAIYVQDSLQWGRLTWEPGMRLSRDSLLDGTQLAPRSPLELDLWGNGKTRLFGGWNRYFGQSLFTYELRSGLPPMIQQERDPDNLSQWQTNRISGLGYQGSALSAPRTDEVVAGIKQRLWGGLLELVYIHRQTEDEFARQMDVVDTDDGTSYLMRLNNNGQSSYYSYQLSWQRHWQKQDLLVSASYSETDSSHTNYDDYLSNDDLQERVWYDNRLLWPEELPREDFNRPWVISWVYHCRPWRSLDITLLGEYRSGYRDLEDSGQDKQLPDGTDADVYEEIEYGGAMIWDSQIRYRLPGWRPGEYWLAEVTINNLLNKKARMGATDNFVRGRQFWLGLRYLF